MARRRVTTDGTRIVDDGDAPDTQTGGDRRWCKAPVNATHVHGRIAGYARLLLQNAQSYHSKNRARERIYEGKELVNNRLAVAALESVNMGIARLNATKSIIDTFVSRLAKDRPLPDIDSTDTEWGMKRKAKQYKQFIVGKMRETDYDDLSRDQLLDGAVLGNGFVRIDNGSDDVFAERILVNELLFDARECRYARPQQAIRTYRLAKDYLAELFPKQRELILRAPASERRVDDNHDSVLIGSLEDYVDVFEAWHLPSSKDSGDGRHAIVIHTGTLVFEEWFEPRFPWTHLRLFKPRNGLLGEGFVDQLASLQHRVNCIVRDLQLNLAATGRGHFLVNEANDIPAEMLTGWMPFKLKYKGGQPPVFNAPQPFHAAQLEALNLFIEKMYDLTGVSKANAESKSTLGAGASGVALDTQYDIDSDRFRMPQANYARSRLDAGQCFIDAAARVARAREKRKGEKRPFVAVTWRMQDDIERLDYDKVVLKEGQFKLKIEAQNFIPETRAGKLSVVTQLAQAGVIEPWLVPTLFDEPDLVQANSIQLAPFRNCLRKMDELADENLPMPLPEQYNDLDLELKISTAYYNRVQNEKAPPEIQDRFRQYVDLVTEAVKQKQAKAQLPPGAVAPGLNPMDPNAAPPAPPMPGAPQAPPMPPMPPGGMMS